MNIPLEILKERFKIDQNGSKIDPNQIKKSGVFTGLKTSLTVQKNSPLNQAKHFLNQKAIKKINENQENTSSNKTSIVYRRNIKNPSTQTKRSAVPHGIIQQNINRNIPQRLPFGKVPGLLNTVGGEKVINEKFKIADKLLNNQNKD